MAPWGIEKSMKALTDAGIRVVAISVDKPEKTREMMVQKAGYTFTFLSDSKLEAIRRYDLVHAEELASGQAAETCSCLPPPGFSFA
jgi:peroxiredoxin